MINRHEIFIGKLNATHSVVYTHALRFLVMQSPGLKYRLEARCMASYDAKNLLWPNILYFFQNIEAVMLATTMILIYGTIAEIYANHLVSVHQV